MGVWVDQHPATAKFGIINHHQLGTLINVSQCKFILHDDLITSVFHYFLLLYLLVIHVNIKSLHLSLRYLNDRLNCVSVRSKSSLLHTDGVLANVRRQAQTRIDKHVSKVVFHDGVLVLRICVQIHLYFLFTLMIQQDFDHV